MLKSGNIPILDMEEMSAYHFGMAQTHLYLPDFDHLFHINKLEDYKGKIQFPLPPHRKQVYDFLFLTKGSTRRSKALNPYLVEENTFFFLPAYQITEHEFMSEDTEGYFCHFNMDIFTKCLPKYNILSDFPFLQYIGNPIVNVEPAIIPHIKNIFQRLETEFHKEKIERFDIVTVYLLALFTEILSFYAPNLQTKKNSTLLITQNYKDALSRHIYEKQKVSDYAQFLNISPNHLNKCVKNITGLSAQDLLNDMILLEAKVLLKQTDLNINEIAYKLTQQNHSEFTRFFKSKTGLTPKEYKINWFS